MGDSATFYVKDSSVGRSYASRVRGYGVSYPNNTTATVYSYADGMSNKHNFSTSSNVGNYTVKCTIGGSAATAGVYSWTWGSGKCNGDHFSCSHYSSAYTSASYTRTCSDFPVTVSGTTWNASSQRDYNKNNHSDYTTRAAGYFTATSSASVTVQHRPLYTVSYNVNGGTGTVVAGTCASCGGNHKSYDYNHTLSSTVLTRDYYIHTGWNTAADGSGTHYNFGGVYTTNADLTLYAEWERITVTNRVKAGNIWKIAEVCVKINDTWIRPYAGYIKVNGVWKRILGTIPFIALILSQTIIAS